MGRLLIAIVLVVAAVPIYHIFIKSPPPLPELDLEEWWGPQQMKTRQDTSIKPFKVQFSQVMIKDLKDRLRDRHPLATPLEGIAFEYGFNSKSLEGWLKYWAEEYPFSARQDFLNKYPQFKTNIQGLDIHFIRVIPEVPAGVEIVPMLLLHGWPGSVREFYEVIPLLTSVSKDRDFAIEVIIPSLPGYGFSSPAVRPGLGVDKVAVVFRNLMHRLGYKKYYIQGGDWGAIISNVMATFFPDEILGYHSNMPFLMTTISSVWRVLGSFWPSLIMESKVQDRVYPLSTVYGRLLEESGYLHLQATKPDTLGVGLSDSPAGLAAYILEKFSTWTNYNFKSLPDGGLTKKFTKEQLMDNVMIYWSTNSITTSMRLYAEMFTKRHFAMNLDEIPTPVPTWFIQPKYELTYFPMWMLKGKYPNIVGDTVLDDGGHFLALEMPELFSSDVIKAVGKFREYHQKNKKTEL
ncbi:juvenile hormone epoxide hydrolase-like isoform X2 [Aricia agestis]|nr:juvenile hormone epoxide hydrolase-like isoform X2 [Aricia agestis]